MSEPNADLPTDPSQARAREDAARARRFHERTGEVELLISAALFFGLLQLPGRLDLWYDTLSPRLDPTQQTVVFTAWYYLKLIVYTLVGAFGVNILSRGYWVGLVGLDSVFPDGVRWDRVRYGPIAKRLYRERALPLPTLARRADDFCSLVFSVAFWTAMLFVLSVVLSGLVGALALGLHRTVFGGVPLFRLWAAGVFGLALLPALPVAIDKVAGARIAPGSRLAGAIRATLDAWFRAFASVLYLPIQLTIASNTSRRLWWPAYGLVFLMLALAFVGGELGRSGRFVLSPTALFPSTPGPRSVDARYFEDRSDAPAATWPTIPSDVIDGPWLRLRVPLVARLDAPRIEAACAGLPSLGRRGLVGWSIRADRADPQAEATLLACAGSIWAVRLDGADLVPEWDFATSRRGGIEALVTYLATDGLEPGAHVLELEEVRLGGVPEADRDLRRHYIRFRR